MKRRIKCSLKSIPILLLLMAMCLGCTGLQRKRRIPVCKALFNLIESDWSRDMQTGLYRVKRNSSSELTREITAGQDCFIGLNSKDVEMLFGKPDTSYRGHMAYYLVEPCLKKAGVNSDGCIYLECVFGPEKSVAGVHIVHVSVKE